MQAPPQAVAQQTPWAHTPEAHCPPLEQAAPFDDLPQELPMQLFPEEQFASLVHAVKHRLPLQVKGAHVVAAGDRQ